MAAYLIDTNVMLAASAKYDPLSRLSTEAEPQEDELRSLVFNWLYRFEKSEDSIVLDEEMLIRDEYERNMPFNCYMQAQEYGLQVLQLKHDQGMVEYVPLDILVGNGERIAFLPTELSTIVTDREDRKWVAASKSAFTLLEMTCPIVYGAESDWYHIEKALIPHGIIFCRLLPDDWYISRHGGGR